MLLLAVDDATGQVVSAMFCEYENTRDYFALMRELIEGYGVPIALYTDRHSVFKHVPGAGVPSAPTQFSRAMDDLGIEMIFAQSPQAKGRVERAAGTFQDRLVTELRLADATTIEEAGVVLKDFLVHFNERFGVPAAESRVAYRPVDEETCLDRVLCFRHSRKVARDNTVRYRRSMLQLLPGTERSTYAGVNVDVLEGLDGQLVIEHDGYLIPSQEAPPRPNILRDVNGHSSHAPLDRNGLGSRWERVLASLDRESRGERSRPRWYQGSQEGNTCAEEAHSEADRKMEGGSSGEAQGTVHQGHNQGDGHPQENRQKVPRGRQSADVSSSATSVDAESIVVCYSRKLDR